MKVKKLIQILEELNPEAIVVVSGYEGGVNNADYVVEHLVALDVNTEPYYGSHEIIDLYDSFNKAQYPKTKYKIEKAVWIR